jgi:hypothetical protein
MDTTLIFNSLTEVLTEQFPDAKEVGRYKGELEEGSKWTPVFPCLFIRVDGGVPAFKLQGGESAQKLHYFSVFICDKDTDKPAVLKNIDTLVGLFNETSLNIENEETGDKEECFITLDRWQFVDYYKGVEAYQFFITISSN